MVTTVVIIMMTSSLWLRQVFKIISVHFNLERILQGVPKLRGYDLNSRFNLDG